MRFLLPVLLCGILCGCREPAAANRAASAESATRRAEVSLTVLVVEDTEIAQAIRLLAGEWNELSGGQLRVTTMNLTELLAADHLGADLVIYPSRQLGTLVARQWLRPLRQSVRDDPRVGLAELLPSVREQCLTLGNQQWGLSLGEQPLLVAWHGAVPPAWPATWDKVESVTSQGKDTCPLAAEFLVRVVAATPPGERSQLLFDPTTMDARLTQPPLVQTLAEMRSARQGASGAGALTAEIVTVPHGTEEIAHLGPPPCAEQTYQSGLDNWERVANPVSPLVFGFAGRLASVSQQSNNAASAFKLLAWLCGGDTGESLSQRSKQTLWFKTTQAARARMWLPHSIREDNLPAIIHLLESREAYVLPRLPGIDDYLAALNAALADTTLPPDVVLKSLQREWDALTDSLGREQQLAAYRLHLGI